MKSRLFSRCPKGLTRLLNRFPKGLTRFVTAPHASSPKGVLGLGTQLWWFNRLFVEQVRSWSPKVLVALLPTNMVDRTAFPEESPFWLWVPSMELWRQPKTTTRSRGLVELSSLRQPRGAVPLCKQTRTQASPGSNTSVRPAHVLPTWKDHQQSSQRSMY